MTVKTQEVLPIPRLKLTEARPLSQTWREASVFAWGQCLEFDQATNERVSFAAGRGDT